jgi:hypothetical protein
VYVSCCFSALASVQFSQRPRLLLKPQGVAIDSVSRHWCKNIPSLNKWWLPICLLIAFDTTSLRLMSGQDPDADARPRSKSNSRSPYRENQSLASQLLSPTAGAASHAQPPPITSGDGFLQGGTIPPFPGGIVAPDPQQVTAQLLASLTNQVKDLALVVASMKTSGSLHALPDLPASSGSIGGPAPSGGAPAAAAPQPQLTEQTSADMDTNAPVSKPVARRDIPIGLRDNVDEIFGMWKDNLLALDKVQAVDSL